MHTDGSVVMTPMSELPDVKGWVGRPAPARSDGGRVLILGARRHCRRLVRRMGHGPWSGLAVVGFVDAAQRSAETGPISWSHLTNGSPAASPTPEPEPIPVLGGLDDLEELVARTGATDLLIALGGPPAAHVRPRIADLTRSGKSVRVHWVGDPARGDRRGRQRDAVARGRRLTDHPSLALVVSLAFKRILDIVGAGLGLVALLPLFVVVSTLILLTDGRPIFYCQERIGYRGRRFRIVKFRSMRRDAEGTTGPIWASNHDERCTRIGAWLRHTNIDELPQLWNVLVGDMSLVGPRPERPIFVEKFRAAIPHYDDRHLVPAGMTGWAQVHGWRGRTSLRKRIQYDLDYIRRWSFGLDIRILFMTVQHVFWGRTTWGPGCAGHKKDQPRSDRTAS